MENNIKIVPINDKHKPKLIEIFNDAFLKKFKFAARKAEHQRSLTKDLGLLNVYAEEAAYVAVDDEEVLGMVLLKSNKFKQVQYELDMTEWEIIKKYGILTVIRLLILGSILEHKTKEGELYIDSISVAKNARGRGVGTLLLNYVEDYAKENGFNQVSLFVMNENPRAKALYERFGFEAVKYNRLRMFKRTTGYSGGWFMVKEYH